MGLDMYLSKKTYVKNWDHMGKEELHKVNITKNGKHVEYINTDRISYIEEEVAYWRKANQIHKWFVDNVQEGNDDCRDYYVEIEQLEALLDTVTEVLNDRNKADKILPCSSGFFFGGDEYDEYYFKDLEYTKEILESILEEPMGGSFYYSSSW